MVEVDGAHTIGANCKKKRSNLVDLSNSLDFSISLMKSMEV